MFDRKRVIEFVVMHIALVACLTPIILWILVVIKVVNFGEMDEVFMLFPALIGMFFCPYAFANVCCDWAEWRKQRRIRKSENSK